MKKTKNLAMASLLLFLLTGCSNVNNSVQNNPVQKSSVQNNSDYNWIKDEKGCKVYNPNPLPNETITWSGSCQDGYASGNGVLQWFSNGKSGNTYNGMMLNGKYNGKGISNYPDGSKYEGDWKDSKKDGNGVIIQANGTKEDVYYKDGQKLDVIEIPDGKILIQRNIYKNDVRKNPDGTKFFNTKINITINYKNEIQTKEISDVYTEEKISDALSPTILFDPKVEILTIFINGKNSNTNNYGMEGYSYIYNVKLKTWSKEKVFDNANWGWYSFFDGSDDGQPVLWHFSFAGYYAVKSQRNLNGLWVNNTMDKISPAQVSLIYKKTKQVLVSSTIGNQVMMELSKIDELAYNKASSINTINSYGEYLENSQMVNMHKMQELIRMN